MDEITKEEEMFRRAEHAFEILNFKGWFGYRRATKIMGFMFNHFLDAETSQESDEEVEIRPIGLIIVGDINSGKTTLATRFLTLCSQQWKKMEKNRLKAWNDFNLLFYEINAPQMTLKRMLAGILRKFGVNLDDKFINRSHRVTLINNLVFELQENNVKMLIIDELQNLLTSPKEEVGEIFIGLKALTNQTNTRFILLGTHDAIRVLRNTDDSQRKAGMKPWIDERFTILELPRWKMNEEYIDLLKTIYAVYSQALPEWDILCDSSQPSRKGKKIINPETAKLILELSEGRLGKILQIIKYAAVSTLLDNRKYITKDDYYQVFNIKYEVTNDGKIKKTPIKEKKKRQKKRPKKEKEK